MPEGPECHAVGRKLRLWLEGAQITEIAVLGGRYAGKGFPGMKLLNDAIANGCGRVSRVAVHGKLIAILLDGGELAIVSTLGLSGAWTKRRTKHCDVRLNTSKGKLWFRDQLHYGTVMVVTRAGLVRRLKRLGPDVTVGARRGDAWWEAFAEKHGDKTVSEVLMAQHLLAGVGNYLKAEILYAAGIAPLSRWDDLPKARIRLLAHCIETIPRKWLKAKVGEGPRMRLTVYGRKRGPAGQPVVRTKSHDNRVTHWVPGVQVEYTAH